MPAASAATPLPLPSAIPVAIASPAASASQGLAAISDGFDVNSMLIPSGGNGAIAPLGGPEVGAFRFICEPGQVKADDPIVYPGQPGKSHLHQFFGNTLANANSTYQSLRTTGDSTCNNALNRSAYWMPAMLDGKGSVVRPDWVSIYYKRFPKNSPDCTTLGKACVDLPRGLRYVFGYNMTTMAAPHAGSAWFNCDGTGAVPGHYANLTEARQNCPVGVRIGAVIEAPNCWNGVDLDSADHRSHVAYRENDPADGRAHCPASHPYIIPTFTMGTWYTSDDNLPTWHLSSDEMLPGAAPGTTFHADWFGAWNDTVMATWMANCIDKMLTCNSGDLGNGMQIRPDHGYSFTANPRLVPVPTN